MHWRRVPLALAWVNLALPISYLQRTEHSVTASTQAARLRSDQITWGFLHASVMLECIRSKGQTVTQICVVQVGRTCGQALSDVCRRASHSQLLSRLDGMKDTRGSARLEQLLNKLRAEDVRLDVLEDLFVLALALLLHQACCDDIVVFWLR